MTPMEQRVPGDVQSVDVAPRSDLDQVAAGGHLDHVQAVVSPLAVLGEANVSA